MPSHLTKVDAQHIYMIIINYVGNIFNTNGAGCTSDTRLSLPTTIYARSEVTSRPLLAISHHYVDVVAASCSNPSGNN